MVVWLRGLSTSGITVGRFLAGVGWDRSVVRTGCMGGVVGGLLSGGLLVLLAIGIAEHYHIVAILLLDPDYM